MKHRVELDLGPGENKSAVDLIDSVLQDQSTFLGDLLISPEDKRSSFRLRNSEIVQRSVHPVDVPTYSTKGWQVMRAGKRVVRMKIVKSHQQKLEDRAWCLLYRMGYHDLNSSRFSIKFNRPDAAGTGTKHIDAFGADDETAIIVECKSREEKGRKSLAKDISETYGLQNYIRGRINNHYKEKHKLKFIWIYITDNIIWSETDVERARECGIYIITENELQYFEAYLKHMGPAGKYQMLGEFLKGQKIPGLSDVKVPAIKGTLGGNVFYSFVTTPRTLLKIAFVNHQALNHPDGTPAYQRMINPSRIKEIGHFISKRNGFFPTNLLVNFTVSPRWDLLTNTNNTDENIKFGWLTLPAVYRSAWIVDGQHRLYGYSGIDDKHLDQSLFVVAFDKMDTYKEADLFITINHKQKSVPSGLLVTLLADLRMGDSDPQTALSALASTVIRRINLDKTSPLALRFEMPDVTPRPGQNLTISEAVKGLKRSGLLGKAVHGTIVPGPLSGKTDEHTVARARSILNGYFEALRAANPERWEAGKSAYICVNPGIRAHLMLIPEILGYLSKKSTHDFVQLSEERVVSLLIEIADPIFKFVKTATDDEIKENFSRKFGDGGVREYLYNLCKIITAKYNEFGSEEFRRFVEKIASNEMDEANSFVMKLSEKMIDCVVKVLKSVYGEQRLDSGEFAYWELGVTERRVIDNAFKKQQADSKDRRKRKEAYLDVIDLKDIVESDNNWLYFSPILNIPLPGVSPKSRKYHTSWIAKFSDIRNIAAHKNSLRTYTDEDLEFIDWLRAEIQPRIDDEMSRK